LQEESYQGKQPVVTHPIYICGSTASGKSSLAIELAKQIGGEIINGDAYQLYQDIETLSASPSAEEKAQVPHHLFNHLPTSASMDAQQFRDLTLPVVQQVVNRDLYPIIVGGSGMYLKFLTHGPSPVPAGDEKLREQLEQKDDDSLIEQLKSIDPEGAVITNLKNRRYVIRALEICLLSGQKMSDIKSDWAKTSTEVDKQLKGFVLQWDPEALRKRIHLRTSQMLENGAIDEVRQLESCSSTCEKAIGIAPIRSYLANEITLDRCHELIYFATCQYAKRQRTWFKKEQWLKGLEMNPSINTHDLTKNIINNIFK